MATLGAALARGLAGYGQGRQEREENDYQRAQTELARKRQEAKDAQDAERNTLMMAQMGQSMRIANAQEADRVGRTQREITESGYRPMGDKSEEYLNAIGLDPASMPTTTVGGQQYRKSGQSTQYTAGLQQRREQENATQQQAAKDAERRGQMIAGLPTSVRARAGGLPDAELTRMYANFLGEAMKPKAPAAPRQPLSKVAPDGNMYYSEDGGRSWRRAQIEGMEQGGSQPTPMQDAPQSQRVPAMQGDSILRGLNLPMDANRTNAQPPRTPAPFGQTTGGPFAKPKAAPQKYVDQVMALDEMDALLDQYEASLKNIEGASVFAGRDPAMIEAQATHRQLLMAAKKAFELGVLNGKDQELIEQAISPPTGLGAVVRTKPNIIKQIGVARRSNALKRDGMNRAYGQFPVEAPRLPAGAIPPDTWNEE